MNNNFVKFAFVGIACAAFCTTTFAAPKGGPRGGTGRPASAPQQTRAPQFARPAAKPSAPPRTRAPQFTRPAAKPSAPQRTSAPQFARPVAKPSAPKHFAPAHHVNQPAFARHGHLRPEPHHHAPPPRFGRHHHIPSHARYWARPAIPLWRVGALHAWEWIEQEWMIVVNGVYYYGDGYYYDGYNYFYNGEYHTVPPTPIVTQVYY